MKKNLYMTCMLFFLSYTMLSASANDQAEFKVIEDNIKEIEYSLNYIDSNLNSITYDNKKAVDSINSTLLMLQTILQEINNDLLTIDSLDCLPTSPDTQTIESESTETTEPALTESALTEKYFLPHWVEYIIETSPNVTVYRDTTDNEPTTRYFIPKGPVAPGASMENMSFYEITDNGSSHYWYKCDNKTKTDSLWYFQKNGKAKKFTGKTYTSSTTTSPLTLIVRKSIKITDE